MRARRPPKPRRPSRGESIATVAALIVGSVGYLLGTAIDDDRIASLKVEGVPWCVKHPRHPRCVIQSSTTTVVTTTTPTTTVITTPSTTSTVPTTTVVTTTVPTTTEVPPTGAYFVGNFDTGNLSQWPDLSNANGAKVVTSPIFGTAGYSLKCTTTNAPDSSVGGDACYVQRGTNDPWQQEGTEAWYRFKLLLPSGNDARYPGSWSPQGGSGWNMFAEWHEPGGYGYSPYFGAWAGGTCLMMRWVPGNNGNWLYAKDVDGAGNPIPIQKDHWYDMLIHVVWSSSNSRGRVEWWLDGRQAYPTANGKDAYGNPLPATFQTMHPSKTDPSRGASPFWQVGHYRGTATWTDTTYMDGVVVGPTRLSVGG